MSIAKRLYEARRLLRRGHRVPADRRNAEAIAEELKKHPPLTIVGRLFADRTIGIGVRLDTSMCLQPEEQDE